MEPSPRQWRQCRLGVLLVAASSVVGAGDTEVAQQGREAGSLVVSKRPASLKLRPPMLPRELARIQSGLCLAHFNLVDNAFSCTAP